jgi:hypothetical protein
MKIEWQAKKIALAVATAIVLVGGNSAFGARPPAATNAIAVARHSDIQTIERAASGSLLAIGRVDRVSRSVFAVSVLGQKFILLAGSANERFMSDVKIGQPVALFGEISRGRYFVDAALRLDGQYVPGASKVYLRGSISSIDKRIGELSVGLAQLDTSGLVSRSIADRFAKGAMTAVLGTQPQVGGRVLVESIRKAAAPDASLGTGRLDASVGTGRPDASVGTGRIDASVGTGRLDASVGTGRPDASVGTGRLDASVGTGRIDASVGTGRIDASLGTGRPDASVGTGRIDASLGTGRPDASVGTGRIDASLGTGRPDASVGTGRIDASLGTGRPEASVGTGRIDASLGTGRPEASVGTGRIDASVGTG